MKLKQIYAGRMMWVNERSKKRKCISLWIKPKSTQLGNMRAGNCRVKKTNWKLHEIDGCNECLSATTFEIHTYMSSLCAYFSFAIVRRIAFFLSPEMSIIINNFFLSNLDIFQKPQCVWLNKTGMPTKPSLLFVLGDLSIWSYFEQSKVIAFEASQFIH